MAHVPSLGCIANIHTGSVDWYIVNIVSFNNLYPRPNMKVICCSHKIIYLAVNVSDIPWLSCAPNSDFVFRDSFAFLHDWRCQLPNWRGTRSDFSHQSLKVGPTVPDVHHPIGPIAIKIIPMVSEPGTGSFRCRYSHTLSSYKINLYLKILLIRDGHI